MQLKGLVKVLTVILILFSLWRLSFTFIAQNAEKKLQSRAEMVVHNTNPEAKGVAYDELVNKAYIHLADSMRGQNVVNYLGLKKYTYQDVKGKELQLGLDLQGGMSVTLEIGLDELIKSMAINPKDLNLEKALEAADSMRGKSDEDFVSLFGRAYEKINPSGRLAPLFSKTGQTKITFNSTNSDVLNVIRSSASEATENTYNVLRTRIDKFGVAQPSINLNKQRGVITVDLAGVRDPESVRRQLQASAKLQFWEVATGAELGQSLNNANIALQNYLKGDTTSVVKNDTANAMAANTDSAKNAVAANDSSKNASDKPVASLSSYTNDSNKATLAGNAPKDLFSIMQPVPGQSNIIGLAKTKDTSLLAHYLSLDAVKNQLPSNIKLLFGKAPDEYFNNNKKTAELYTGVYAVKVQPGSDKAKLEGDAVKSAKFDYQPQTNQAEIALEMNAKGTLGWAKLTKDNVDKFIAIALDDYVYSAPVVREAMPNGRASITGNFSAKEGTELANILQSGKLAAPAKIVQEQVVGPTLGQESINGGMLSFAISFAIIFILMVVYYNTGGWVANISLILNLLFTFGILANMGATLTMPGIAGLILGIGMAVDVNVIIFERIKEELSIGKSYAQAVDDGYKRSYAPVFDGHVTGLITAVILAIFGVGPILGFATTQILALILSLFCGILVSRLITDTYMHRGRHFNYFTSISKRLFKKAHFKFIEARKYTYVISGILIIMGIASFFHGFDYGVEFSGGRSYTIKFDQPHKVSEVREKLHKYLGNYPVVKTIGNNDQLNITTDYLIEKSGKEVDAQVMDKLYSGLQSEKFLPASVDLNTFETKYIQKSDKVEPSISKDLINGAKKATIIAIIAIFFYIFIRFRKWQYSMGTILSLIHDSAVILAVFSFFKGIVPFALEIDQHFIAALLTVIGFSMNDTVIVFDRIREYFRKTPNANKVEVIDRAINDTLSRTIMTSLTVFITILILFIFGGEALRGFSFAMLIGVLVGTYSSIFVAAPVLVDMDKKDTLRREENKEERIKVLKQQA